MNQPAPRAEEMIHVDTPVTALAVADATYLNSRLARFYSIDGVMGDDVRRVLVQVAAGTRTVCIPRRSFAALLVVMLAGVSRSVMARSTLVTAVLTASIGTVIGLISGWYGGRVDAFLMRFCDGWIALPLLPVLIVLAAVDPTKPVIIAEWGVGEFPEQGSKGDWIRTAMAGMRSLRRPRVSRLRSRAQQRQAQPLRTSRLRRQACQLLPTCRRRCMS